MEGGTPVGKLGAMHFILNEDGERVVDEGFHSIRPSGTGYIAETGATSYRITETENGYEVRKESSRRGGGVRSAAARLDPSEEVKTEDRLDPKNQRVEQRETLQETEVGVPGLKARRKIERYTDEGVEKHDYSTEIVIMGQTITLEGGTVSYAKNEETSLERSFEQEIEAETS